MTPNFKFTPEFAVCRLQAESDGFATCDLEVKLLTYFHTITCYFLRLLINAKLQ